MRTGFLFVAIMAVVAAAPGDAEAQAGNRSSSSVPFEPIPLVKTAPTIPPSAGIDEVRELLDNRLQASLWPVATAQMHFVRCGELDEARSIEDELLSAAKLVLVNHDNFAKKLIGERGLIGAQDYTGKWIIRSDKPCSEDDMLRAKSAALQAVWYVFEASSRFLELIKNE